MKRLALVLFLAAAGVAAQPVPDRPLAVPAVQTITWTATGGMAADLAVGADGAVFAIDPEGRVWLRRPGANVSWISLPGDFRRVAAASAKLAWAIDANDDLFAYNGTWWQPMGERYPVKAADVSVSSGGVAYATTPAGGLVLLDARRGAVEISDLPGELAQVAVDDRDLPWAIDRNGGVHRHDGKRWTTLPGIRARDLSVANGGVWLLAADGQLVALNANGTAPRPLAVRAAAVATAPGGLPWIATADGRIYANNPDTSGRKATQRTEREQVFTQLINWQRVNGSARQLAISAQGAILALGREGEVWQWKSRNNWGHLPGRLARIALDNANTPWGIDATGRILRYQGSYWTELPGSASDIAAGADGSLWILSPEGLPARWVARTREWRPAAPAPAAAAKRIAVTPDGQPWIIDGEGAVSRFEGKQWSALPEIDAADIGIGPEGTVFVAGNDKRLWRWDATGKRWEYINGEAAGVAVGPRGKPWIATPAAGILASAFFDELPDSKVNTVSIAAAAAARAATGVIGQPGTGTGAPKGRDGDPLQYLKVTGTARDIAIGAEGSVFAITYDGGLARWSNTRNAFVSFAGQFTRIAVAPDGKPWGVTTKGEVFRHDGTTWKLVRNIAAQDIAVGFDGTVIVSGPLDVLHKYDAAADAFVRLPQVGDNAPPTGTRVAVDPAGKPWVIASDGFVARCGSGVCERLPVKARSIDIGPEGSIVIVDTDRVLKRWSAREEKFERIDGIADLVELAAVGPRGKPWLLSTKSEVWASEFFARDESRDATTAAVTSAVIAQSTSPSTTPPVFTFLVSMSFDKVDSSFVWNSGALQVAARPTGGVTIVDENLSFWNYNETTKNITKDTTVSAPPLGGLEPMRSFIIGKDGTYWVTSTWATRRVWRRQGNQWIQVSGTWTTDAAPITVTEGQDGTIYASGPDQQLYRYDTTSKRFVKVTLALPNGVITSVAIDPSGHFWVTSENGTAGLYEYVGNTWILRLSDSTNIANQCRNQAFACASIGANGSVYSVDTSIASPRKLMRWNAASSIWEKVTSSPSIESGGVYVIGPDGRPWVVQVVSSGSGDGLYRAR